MAKTGQLNKIWESASTTHVQFNLVSIDRIPVQGDETVWQFTGAYHGRRLTLLREGAKELAE